MCSCSAFFVWWMSVSLFFRLHFGLFTFPKINNEFTFCIFLLSHLSDSLTHDEVCETQTICNFLGILPWYILQCFSVLCVFDFSANNRHTRHELYIFFSSSPLDIRSSCCKCITCKHKHKKKLNGAGNKNFNSHQLYCLNGKTEMDKKMKHKKN